MFTACGIMHRRCCQLVTCHQSAASLVHYTTSCKHSLALLKMGETIAPKRVELIQVINKLSLLHLVGCLNYCKNVGFVTCTRLFIYLSLGCYNSMDSSSAERVKTLMNLMGKNF